MVTDQSGDPGGLALERADLGVAEVPVLQCSDMHDAEQSPLSDQRHSEHRTDALLPQDRVHHRVRTDVVEPDRCPRRRDLAGEPQADGHPDALVHLVFETLRGARNQL